MAPIAKFFTDNIVVVYFFYGLAFFCMGLFVLVESDRKSTLRLAQVMGPLAGFGIFHGLHEWIEMFQNMPTSLMIPQWVLSENLRLTHLVVSFIFLIIFGVRLIYTNRAWTRDETPFVIATTGALVLVWGLSLLITARVFHLTTTDLPTAIDVLARYTLGIPGALIAAWGITLERGAFQKAGLTKSGHDLMRAALGLFIYGVIGQVFVKPSFLFPANVVNADLFINTFGIPIQLFRAVVASFVTIFMVRGLRAFEFVRQQKLLEANEARLAAQALTLSIQKTAKAETDRLNGDLRAALADLRLLFDFSSSMAKTLERDTVVNTAVEQIVNALFWVKGAVILYHFQADDRPVLISDDHFWVRRADPADAALFRLGRAVFTQQRPLALLADKIVAAGRVDQPAGDYALGLPLSGQNQVAGVLIVQVDAAAFPIGANQIKLLQTLVGQLSIALENASLYQKVLERDRLRGELLHQVVSAQEKERQRIARELHDGTGQLLTALGLGFAAAHNNLNANPALVQDQLGTLKGMVNQALQDLRDLIADLRPSVLDDLGLLPALQGLVKTFQERTQDSGQRLEIALDINGPVSRLQPDVETVAFRIVQEALTNVVKHAQADSVHIQLQFSEQALQMTIADDGVGFASDRYLHQKALAPAWGLLGMQERVALVGGDLKIHSQVGQGTTIDVCLPFMHTGVGHVENTVAVSR